MAEEPRPATASMRPGAIAAAVASCWNTRSGSSVDSTVTVVPSAMRSVDAAAAGPRDVGGGSGSGGHERRRGGQRHRAGVVLAEAEEVEPDLLGELHGFEDVADGLRGR